MAEIINANRRCSIFRQLRKLYNIIKIWHCTFVKNITNKGAENYAKRTVFRNE